MCTVRLSEAGVHLFDRLSGLNVLLDEVDVPAEQISHAPRYLSVALTNACELRCAYCYAPKYGAALDADTVVAWAVELDRAGYLGVGPRVCKARGLLVDRGVIVERCDKHSRCCCAELPVRSPES